MKTTTTLPTKDQLLHACEEAGVVFVGLSPQTFYFRRSEGTKKVLSIPLREAGALRILLEMCNDHARSKTATGLAAVSSPAQQSRHFAATQGD